MATDRGGLVYRIQIKDAFSRSTQKFRDELALCKAAFGDFASGNALQGQAIASLKASAAAAGELSKANNTAAKATKARATETKKALDIDDRVLLAAERAKIARDVENRAREVGLDLSRKGRKALDAEAKAQAAAGKFAEQRATTARRNQLLEAQGIKVSKDKAKALTLEEKAAQRAAKQIENVALAEKVREKLRAQSFAARPQSIETAAQEKLFKASQARLVQTRAQELADARGIQFGKKKVQQLTEEQEATKRLAALDRRQRVQARVDAVQDLRAGFARLKEGGSFLAPPPEATKRLKTFKDLLAQTDTQGNNLFFTFRRLFGVLAAFQAARLAVAGFFATIREGLSFNSQIEQARISISGLITAAGDLRDAFGNVLSPADQLVEAEKLATSQVKLLRQAALSTTATFEELLNAFQVAIVPGLAGGLTLDEVRKLAVNVSQAAQALGIAQNQLSEEIRSIIQGTGQLRTTRLLALVSNEEIRRAREAGTLFQLLNERLGGFNDAAEKAARSTLPGVLNRIRDFLQNALGGASKGLFQDLLDLGNNLFDRVLTVRNAIGEIQPNPRVVAILEDIFSALRAIVQSAVAAGKELGFRGAQEAVRAFANGLLIAGELAIGVARGVFAVFSVISSVFKTVSSALGLSNAELAQFIGLLATIITPLLLIKNLFLSTISGIVSIIGFLQKLPATTAAWGKALNSVVLGPWLAIGAAIVAVSLAFNKLIESVFDINVSLKDTVVLIVAGLEGAGLKVAEVMAIAVHEVVGFIDRSLIAIRQFGENAVREAKILKAALFNNEEDLQALQAQGNKDEKAHEDELAASRTETESKVAKTRAKAAALQLTIEQRIAKTIGDAAGTDAQGAGFNAPFFDFDAFSKKIDEAKVDLGGGIPNSFLTTAKQQVQQIQDEMTDLQTEARKARAELNQVFRSAFNSAPLEGVAGQIRDIFRAGVLDAAEKARSVTLAILSTQKQIAALQALSFPAGSDEETARVARINNLRADEVLLLGARNKLQSLSLGIARTKAAVLAGQEIPKLVEENKLLAQRARAEKAITLAQRSRATATQTNVANAQAQLDGASLESAKSEAQIRAQIAAVQQVALTATDAQGIALNAYVAELQTRLALEQEVSGAQQEQLAIALKQAQLIQSGSVTQGLREGLVQLASELPTFFEAGVNIAKTAVQSFASFLSGAIRSAFDPNANTSFREQLGNFLLNLGQAILDQLIAASIGQLLSTSLGLGGSAAALQLAATTLGAVVPGLSAAALQLQVAASALAVGGSFGVNPLQQFPIGANTGGYFGKAKGHKRGGAVRGAAVTRGRPRGLHHTDKIPIWAARGEFMQRAAAVRKYGLNTMHAINQGLVDPMSLQALAGAVAPSAARVPAVPGYAEGGLISDQIATGNAVAAHASSGSGGGLTIAGVVASEGAMDRLIHGGKGALLRFMRENASTITSSLDRKRRS